MNNMKEKVNALNRKMVNDTVLNQLYNYQRIYGFEMGTGKEATHNNEADAFKHALMQAYLSIVNGRTYSKLAGDYHEYIEDWGKFKKAPTRCKALIFNIRIFSFIIYFI